MEDLTTNLDRSDSSVDVLGCHPNMIAVLSKSLAVALRFGYLEVTGWLQYTQPLYSQTLLSIEPVLIQDGKLLQSSLSTHIPSSHIRK